MRPPRPLPLLATLAALSGTSLGQVVGPPPPQAEAQQAPQISAYVRRVLEDRDGSLWFGTNDEGVCRYDGTSLTYFGPREGLAGSAVRGILQDHAGVIWFATEGGVSRYQGGTFTNFKIGPAADDSDVWSMMLDRSGTLWVGTLTGVRRFDGAAFVPFPLPRPTVENSSPRFSPLVVFGMAQDRKGNIWFGTDGEGVHRYDGARFTTYTTEQGLGGNEVRCVFVDRRGRVWVGTDGGGVTCFDGAEIRTFTAKDGLSNDRVFDVLEDREGNIWFSALGAGVCRYDDKSFTQFGPQHGLTLSHAQSMHEGRDGMLWFGCSGGLFRFDGASFINVRRDGPWPPKAKQAGALDAPMASFAGMMSGRWKRTFTSGSSMIATWHWGPGHHSVRVMTEGFAGEGQPWNEVQVYYWHPGRQQVCVWSASPFAHGLSEGTIRFDSKRAEGFMDMRQFGFDPNRNGGRRKLGLRWAFDGPDRYRDTLLEDTGQGYETLVEWDQVRIGPDEAKTATPPGEGEARMPKVSERMQALQPLLEGIWESTGGDVQRGAGAGDASRIRTTFEWMPGLELIYARAVELSDEGEPAHVLDAYFYYDMGTASLHCRAFTHSGGVYEGEVRAPQGGSLQIDLKGCEGERNVATAASIDFMNDGTVRERMWSDDLGEYTLMRDALHLTVGEQE